MNTRSTPQKNCQLEVARNISVARLLSNLAGWSLGWAVGGLAGERLGGLYSFAAAAGLSTALEWLLLRLILPKAHQWAILSALGIALGSALSIALNIPVGALLLVLSQWLFFTRAYLRTLQWLIASLAGLIAGGAVATIAYLALGGRIGAAPAEGPSGPLLGLCLGALFGLSFGSFRALALTRVLKDVHGSNKAR